MLVEAPDGSWVKFRSPEWMARTDWDLSIPDPLSVVVPLIDGDPDWLVLAGLGDSPDGQEALKRWPNAKLIGIDPDKRAIDWQRRNGWPVGHPLLQEALGDQCRTALMNPDKLCHASLHPANLENALELAKVQMTMLDALNAHYGPFDRSVVWLDLEGLDYWALLGAEDLLDSGQPLAVGVEVRYEEAATWAAMRQLLWHHGYRLALAWFRQWWGHNEVYVRMEDRL